LAAAVVVFGAISLIPVVIGRRALRRRVPIGSRPVSVEKSERRARQKTDGAGPQARSSREAGRQCDTAGTLPPPRLAEVHGVPNLVQLQQPQPLLDALP
jgi:hypothetical protein